MGRGSWVCAEREGWGGRVGGDGVRGEGLDYIRLNRQINRNISTTARDSNDSKESERHEIAEKCR